MKKVLLLGDSICAWYSRRVAEALDGKCEVVYDNTENGRFSAFTLHKLGQLIEKHGHFDIVHFNNGYWDMATLPNGEYMLSPEEYTHFLKRIIDLSRFCGADVIFATTVPLPSDGEAADNAGTGSNVEFKANRVEFYNKAATELCEKENVTINDLYSLCLKVENYYKGPDNLHLTDEGNQACAEQVAKVILEEIERRKNL